MKLALTLALLTAVAAAKCQPETATAVIDEFFLKDFLNATSHYGDPKTGCESDEIQVQVQGVQGDFCTPPCSLFKPCPADVPTGVTAKPMCALQSTSGGKYCALICSPGNDAQCGTNASCKAISGLGICTYDD
uniref:Uncharacterized protein n=1 Tax=Lotharella globosa TaxID=91324 RepID=A0A7S3Z7N5_9EUKA